MASVILFRQTTGPRLCRPLSSGSRGPPLSAFSDHPIPQFESSFERLHCRCFNLRPTVCVPGTRGREKAPGHGPVSARVDVDVALQVVPQALESARRGGIKPRDEGAKEVRDDVFPTQRERPSNGRQRA